MLNVYKTVDNNIVELNQVENGVWINLINPTDEELDFIEKTTGADKYFLTAALDEEERPRTEKDIDSDTYMIIIDIPYTCENGSDKKYDTLPLGIIYTSLAVITVCLAETEALNLFVGNKEKNINTLDKENFILNIIYKITDMYLRYLIQIDRISEKVEIKMQKSVGNEELLQLLDMEKSLVYFSAAIKSNSIVYNKLVKFNKYKTDDVLNEYVNEIIIENTQAQEMTEIYISILNGTTDAYASIISNNLNVVMKALTLVTIILSIPTMIAGFYGMNVAGIPFANHPIGFWIVIVATVLICIGLTLYMYRKNLF